MEQTLSHKANINGWETVVDQLASNEWAVRDDFIKMEEVLALRDHIDQLREEGQLKKAGIGKQLDYTIEKEVRGDFIYWVPLDTEHAVLSSVLSRLTEFRDYINRTCYLGLKSYETHLTSYPKGSFYKIHKDRFRQAAHRVLSFVLYLNPEWTPQSGGELVIYPEREAPVSILPQAGRLAVFKSELDHEVKICHAQRYSMTGWMLDTLPGTTFL